MQPMLPFPRDGSLPKLRIRRRVYRPKLEPLADGAYVFAAKSFSLPIGVTYRCVVNPTTGYVWCSCRDFGFRKDKFDPTYWEGSVCKHLRRAIRTVKTLVKKHAGR